jgi:hypothetical protein
MGHYVRGARLNLAASFLALSVALAVGHDEASAVAASFAWGAMLFGGAITVYVLLALVLMGLRGARARAKPRTSVPSVFARRERLVMAGLILAFALIYVVDGATGMAFLAGYGPGATAGAELLALCGLRPVRHA